VEHHLRLRITIAPYPLMHLPRLRCQPRRLSLPSRVCTAHRPDTSNRMTRMAISNTATIPVLRTVPVLMAQTIRMVSTRTRRMRWLRPLSLPRALQLRTVPRQPRTQRTRRVCRPTLLLRPDLDVRCRLWPRRLQHTLRTASRRTNVTQKCEATLTL